MSDYLLKIFRASIPFLPKTAVKFGLELQLALQPMIIKPSTAGGLLVSDSKVTNWSPQLSSHVIHSLSKKPLHACVLSFNTLHMILFGLLPFSNLAMVNILKLP